MGILSSKALPYETHNSAGTLTQKYCSILKDESRNLEGYYTWVVMRAESEAVSQPLADHDCNLGSMSEYLRYFWCTFLLCKLMNGSQVQRQIFLRDSDGTKKKCEWVRRVCFIRKIITSCRLSSKDEIQEMGSFAICWFIKYWISGVRNERRTYTIKEI